MSHKKVFTVKSLLGKGGYGRVVHVVHNLDKRSYALKTVKIKEGSSVDVLKEVEAMAALRHNNIVSYHHCWIDDRENDKLNESPSGSDCEPSSSSDASSSLVTFRNSQQKSTKKGISAAQEMDEKSYTETLTGSSDGESWSKMLFIQMELCDMSLDKWISSNTQKTYAIILHAFFQIAVAMKFIHKEGIIHGDLKPNNIFVKVRDQKGNLQIKIGDFGLAKFLPTRSAGIVMENSFYGTLLYAAPEKVWKVNYDVYAMGIILFEMLYPLKTASERVDVLTSLKDMKFPASFKINHTEEMMQIQEMLKPEPELRKTSKQVHIWCKKYYGEIKLKKYQPRCTCHSHEF